MSTIAGRENPPWAIAGRDTTKPGQSVVVPLAAANTGSTPLNAFVTRTIVNAHTNSLMSYLNYRFHPVAPLHPGSYCLDYRPGLIGSLRPGGTAIYCIGTSLAATDLGHDEHADDTRLGNDLLLHGPELERH